MELGNFTSVTRVFSRLFFSMATSSVGMGSSSSPPETTTAEGSSSQGKMGKDSGAIVKELPGDTLRTAQSEESPSGRPMMDEYTKEGSSEDSPTARAK